MEPKSLAEVQTDVLVVGSGASGLTAALTAAGLSRFRTGVPSLRNITPEYFDGRKPLDQLAEPPGTPRPTQMSTTNSGRFLFSLPRP